MKKTCVYLLALPALVAGCTRATFPPVVVQDSGPDGPPDGGTVDAGICQADVGITCASTTLNSGVCDPVCQTGSCAWCQGQKCSVRGDNGESTCTSAGPKTLNDYCTITNPNTRLQFDNCGLGYICMGDFGAGVTQCFSFCGSSADCAGNVDCTPRPVAADPQPPSILAPRVKVCDPAYGTCPSCCDPIGNTGCPVQGGQTCYLVSNDPKTQTNRTVCEFVSGGLSTGAPCSYSRDCLQGSGCYAGVCHTVCNPSVSSTCANTNAPCIAPTGSQYGYCEF